MNAFSKSASVIIGGGLGSYLRYLVQGWVGQKAGTGFPYGTLLINLSGAFLIGLLMSAFMEQFETNPSVKLFFTVGLLGGFTTFSAAAWESYQLFALGGHTQGILYVAGSVLGGAVAVSAGVWLGRLI